ncbi:hypothetical protein, partial [Klebsiella pneumoniae]|uniref:hypothetical protein n=1 Tax=Klebsiella pneumoniae TaxID=573 RepID=UPI003B592B66
SSGFLRGFDPLVLLYLSPQETEQFVEYFIRIEFVLILSLKPSLDFSRLDSSRLEFDHGYLVMIFRSFNLLENWKKERKKKM